MDIYDRIDFLLQENKMSAYKLSKETGISTGLISQWKKRSQKPSTEKLRIIADYFGVSVDYLLTGEEPEQKETSPDKSKDTLEKDIQFALFGTHDEITEELYEDVQAYARFKLEQKKRQKKG